MGLRGIGFGGLGVQGFNVQILGFIEICGLSLEGCRMSRTSNVPSPNQYVYSLPSQGQWFSLGPFWTFMLVAARVSSKV